MKRVLHVPASFFKFLECINQRINSLTLKTVNAKTLTYRVLKCDVAKKKFAKLWDMTPFLNRASLKKGPCQKLPLNCNFQPKYKG